LLSGADSSESAPGLGGEPVKIGVMQICDSLDAGGMERVAVNVANGLPRERYESHLCTTRLEGPLSNVIAPDVHRLHLQRKSTYDVSALSRLSAYVRRNHVKILHAHGPSLFFATAASLLVPQVKVIWHDHFGAYETERRKPWLYRLPAARLSAVISVSQKLAEWAETDLRMPKGRVRYIPNFVAEPPASAPITDLPGTPGSRIVCAANLRPQKDHPTLLAAMSIVVGQRPDAHLILLGGSSEAAYTEHLQRLMSSKDLQGHVSWLGSHPNVAAVLKECAVGVLSSASEGLPLALIEYGMAGLPAVATRVGQNAEVLENGQAGLLVPPAAPEALADALLSILNSADLGRRLSQRFSGWVRERYSARKRISEITELYEAVLSPIGNTEHQPR